MDMQWSGIFNFFYNNSKGKNIVYTNNKNKNIPYVISKLTYIWKLKFSYHYIEDYYVNIPVACALLIYLFMPVPLLIKACCTFTFRNFDPLNF